LSRRAAFRRAAGITPVCVGVRNLGTTWAACATAVTASCSGAPSVAARSGGRRAQGVAGGQCCQKQGYRSYILRVEALMRNLGRLVLR
jgi:hypothetical protein